jgi:hypothetical protein
MSDVAAPPISKELIARLPKTFGPALNDQFKRWDLLFPAEQRSLKAQLDWLSHLAPDEFGALLKPIFDVEGKMELPRWDSSTAGLSVQDAGILARSPYYPQWRSAVENAFAKIDEGVEKSGALKRPRGLLVCVLPPGLPLASQPLWPSLAKQGAWVPLDKPFGQMLGPLALSLAGRRLPEGLENLDSTWVFECDTALLSLAESTPSTTLSWTALATLRREFLNRLNRISRNLHSVDQTNEELNRLEIGRLLGRPVGTNPKLREFVRSLLLSGNGSLVFNNSFVQWGSAEALRRVQPQVLIASFGIRPKLKPFSSSVLFEDQTRANPVPEQDDPAGSLVDGLKLAEYVYLAGQRVRAYQGRSLTLMAADGLDRVLVLGPERPAAARCGEAGLTSFLLRWLARE